MLVLGASTIPGEYILPEVLGGRVVVTDGDDGGSLRQIVKHSGAVVKKQGQVVLAATRTAPRADFRESGALVGVAIEAVIPVELEATHRCGIQGVLPRRQQVDRLYPGDGALAIGFKGTQRIDLIIQQVNAVG